ncbi:MAG: tetratricopeptide repeat protein [Verrucomicrobiales bacterium]
MTAKRLSFVVAAISIAVTCPVLWHDFVSHDDPQEIHANPLFNPLTKDSCTQIWTRPDFSFIYIPVNYSVLALTTVVSRWLSGGETTDLSPVFFHLLGVALHAANSLMVLHLVQLLVRTVGRERRSSFASTYGSAAGALLFALHPAQVESYARAGNITVTLGAFLGLSALLVEFSGVIKPKSWLHVGASILFVLGLLTRPSLVVWPVVAALVCVTSFPRRVKRISAWFLGRLAIAGGYVALTLALQRGVPSSQLVSLPWWQRPLLAADSLFWYGAQALWPARLSIDHGRTPFIILGSKGVWLAPLGLAAAALAVWLLVRAKQHLLAVGICLFAIAVLPVSGLLPAPAREHFSVVYDRHLYFAMLGIAVAAVAALQRIPSDWKVPMAVLVLSSAGWASAANVGYWKNSLTLFEHVLRVNPKSWYGHARLGSALVDTERPAEAIPHFLTVLELNPRMTETNVNLGDAYLQIGRLDDAERVLVEAVKLRPEDPNAHNNLGVVGIQKKRWKVAESEIRTALALNPMLGQAWNNLGLVLAEKGELPAAIECHRRAVNLMPNWAPAQFSLGRALIKAGQVDEGLKRMESACMLAPSIADWRAELESARKQAAETKEKL